MFLVVAIWTSIAAGEKGKDTGIMAIMNQPPYGFVDRNGNKSGYFYDIGKTILNNAGISKDIQFLPMKRLLKDVTAGVIDCTFVVNTPYARSHYRPIAPLGISLEAVIVPKAGVALSRYGDLQGLKIAVPRGVRFDDRFDRDTSLTKIATNDTRQSVLILERGRVDAIAGVWGRYLYNARKLGFQPDKIFGRPLMFNRFPIWLVCRQGGPSQLVEEKLKRATLEL